MGFIFQVRLPRNQLYVCRVSPKTRIQQILEQVCHEKGFDPRRYQIRKTGKLKFQTIVAIPNLDDFNPMDCLDRFKQDMVIVEFD